MLTNKVSGIKLLLKNNSAKSERRDSYPDVRTGIRAQIQHLKAYASTDPLNQECVDERYEYVTKGAAPYVEWLGQKENPQGTGWATAENYGYSIVEMIHKMRQQ